MKVYVVKFGNIYEPSDYISLVTTDGPLAKKKADEYNADGGQDYAVLCVWNPITGEELRDDEYCC